MDTDTLKAFIAVAESGSFSTAAERLHLTQPAISKRIANLESSLDTRVFDRVGKQVVLTEAGHALLPRAHHILEEFKDTRRAIHNLSGTVSGSLHLSISHHIGLHRLPSVLREYSKRYPHVELHLDFLESEVAYDAVSHGHIELALITLTPTPSVQVNAVPVWQDTLHIVAAPTHPLHKTHQLKLVDLAQHKAILPDTNTFTRQIADAFFVKHKLVLAISTTTNYLETIKMMVSVGLAWSILPETMLDKQVKSLNIPTFNLTRDLGYIYHKHKTLSNAARAFVDLLNEYKDQ
jgi:DNA-binding transcriptional LysR family regulator